MMLVTAWVAGTMLSPALLPLTSAIEDGFYTMDQIGRRMEPMGRAVTYWEY